MKQHFFLPVPPAVSQKYGEKNWLLWDKKEKSSIWETMNLLACADTSTDTLKKNIYIYVICHFTNPNKYSHTPFPYQLLQYAHRPINNESQRATNLRGDCLGADSVKIPTVSKYERDFFKTMRKRKITESRLKCVCFSVLPWGGGGCWWWLSGGSHWFNSLVQTLNLN